MAIGSDALRRSAESVAIPLLALAASMVLFGAFVLIVGADPFAVYGLMYKAAFGTWFSWQNSLSRAAPLVLTALCTALPAQMGMVIIGGEGALVLCRLYPAACTFSTPGRTADDAPSTAERPAFYK